MTDNQDDYREWLLADESEEIISETFFGWLAGLGGARFNERFVKTVRAQGDGRIHALVRKLRI